jgi:hypothetical protein
LGAAGDADGRNVFKVRFATNPCSDMPQLQAWDDENMNTVVSESLQGTVGGGNQPQIAAAHTSNIKTGGPWVPAANSAGPGAMQDPNSVGTSHRANRLRGGESYLELGDVADAPPAADDERHFQLAALVHDDSGAGTSGHLPVLAVKTFYAGAPPVVSFWYNRGEDDLVPAQVNADWAEMTSEDKGTAMPIAVLNTIHFTGVSGASPAVAIAPVTKPGSGEKAAEEQWIQTAL